MIKSLFYNKLLLDLKSNMIRWSL